MFRPTFQYLALIFLSLTALRSHAQLDSMSVVTISEYQEDTLSWQDVIIQHYLEGKLIYERKQKGIGSDEFDYEVLNNFYDHNGELRESVLVERDGYACPPTVISDDSFWSVDREPEDVQFILPEYNFSKNGMVLPDSIPDTYQFCGRYYRKVTHYERYLHVSKIEFFYNDDAPIFFTDSVFFNRYGDKIRELSYKNDDLIGEELFAFTYDEHGRVLEKVWRNLTIGYEFENISRYAYAGDQQLQVYHSHNHLDSLEKSYSIVEYDSQNRMKKNQQFQGDSLVSTHLYGYQHSGNQRIYIVTNVRGDTINVSHYVKFQHKNRTENWSHHFQNGSHDYQYSVKDSIPMKSGHRIVVSSFRITQTQFEEREAGNKRRNRLQFKEINTYDRQGRLIREEEEHEHFGEKDIRYEYRD